MGVMPVPALSAPYSQSVPIRKPWLNASSATLPVVLNTLLNISTPGVDEVENAGKAVEPALGMPVLLLLLLLLARFVKPGFGDAR